MPLTLDYGRMVGVIYRQSLFSPPPIRQQVSFRYITRPWHTFFGIHIYRPSAGPNSNIFYEGRWSAEGDGWLITIPQLVSDFIGGSTIRRQRHTTGRCSVAAELI